jgi:hypothetical protein
VQRIRLAGIRICHRCGRGKAEFIDDAGVIAMRVAIDPLRSRELSRDEGEEDLLSLSDLVLTQLAERGVDTREVVFDVEGDCLRALLSFTHDGEPDVIECTPQEGISLGVRGALKFYATTEALAQAEHDHRAHEDPDESTQ